MRRTREPKATVRRTSRVAAQPSLRRHHNYLKLRFASSLEALQLSIRSPDPHNRFEYCAYAQDAGAEGDRPQDKPRSGAAIPPSAPSMADCPVLSLATNHSDCPFEPQTIRIVILRCSIFARSYSAWCANDCLQRPDFRHRINESFPVAS